MAMQQGGKLLGEPPNFRHSSDKSELAAPPRNCLREKLDGEKHRTRLNFFLAIV
jgi:hypothetical protein